MIGRGHMGSGESQFREGTEDRWKEGTLQRKGLR